MSPITPTRAPNVAGWIVSALVGTALGIAALWALRPRWSICVDGQPEGGCYSGFDSVAATAGTIALVGLFGAVVIAAAFIRGRMRLPILVAALLAILFVIVAAALFSVAV